MAINLNKVTFPFEQMKTHSEDERAAIPNTPGGASRLEHQITIVELILLVLSITLLRVEIWRPKTGNPAIKDNNLLTAV